MEHILEKELKDEIFTDSNEYFFTFLADRLEYSVELWAKELEKKFNKKFKPIWILSSKQNELFTKENFIVMNKELQEIKQKLKRNSVVYLEDYEDTNAEFSESEFIQELTNKLVEKQGRVFILGFTSACLRLKNPKAIILGPNSEIATKYDNKAEHIRLFDYLDLPRNKTKIYTDLQEIKTSEKYPFYISACYTSGGHESGTIYSEQDLEIFYSKLRELNKHASFLVAELITDIKLSPNINAIVCNKDDTKIICIADQILRGNQYLGNIYPSKANEEERKVMSETAIKIGNYLSNLGFRGLFGLDFIINSKGKIFVVDLNPRRQGGYLCNILMALPKINIPQIELNLVLGENSPKFDYKDFQTNTSWAHSKIKPYFNNMRILNCFKIGDPTLPFIKIGSEYRAIFYPKDSLLMGGNTGYLIVSGKSYEEVKDKIIKETEITISKNFELYEGLTPQHT